MTDSLPGYLTSPPVIVCGLPRSGTSLTRDLLNTSRNVLILDEFPSQRFSALFSLAEQLAQVDREQVEAWRNLSGERLARALELVATAWALASRKHLWQRFRAGRFDRIGMKTPLAELDYEVYERVLSGCAPFLVYCWRPPLDVYESLLSLSWGAHHTPESFLGTLEQSLGVILRLLRDHPGNIFVFDVARTRLSLQERKRVVASLFSVVGARKTWRTFRFLRRWPTVNPRGKGPPSPLGFEEKQARLSALERLLERSEVLAHFSAVSGVGDEPRQLE